MGPVIWRPKSYYLKLLAIWCAFGLCVYMYHYRVWHSLEPVSQTLYVRQDEGPKTPPQTAQELPHPRYMAIDSAASSSSEASTTRRLPSVARTSPPWWINRNTDAKAIVKGKLSFKEERGVFMHGDMNDDAGNDNIIINDSDDDDDDGDDDIADEDFVTDAKENVNRRRSVNEQQQVRNENQPKATIPDKPSSAVPNDKKSSLSAAPVESNSNAEVQKRHLKTPNVNAPDLQRKDIFTRDISELTRRELIYRFAHNKEEVSRNERYLPNYLKLRNLHWTMEHAGNYPPSLYAPPPEELPEQRLPAAIIIGCGKSGTRALLDFLSMHPLVVTPDPEIHFFDFDENFAKGLDWYRGQMPLSYSNQPTESNCSRSVTVKWNMQNFDSLYGRDELSLTVLPDANDVTWSSGMTMEKTPSYIWSERAVEEIYKMNSSIKLIAIVRDPVERIISQASRGNNTDLESFFLAFENGHYRIKTEGRTVHWGIYVEYLKAWTAKFPPSQLHILEAKELIKNPALELQKIERFLGLPPMITSANFHFNVTKGFYCMRPFYPKVIKCLPETKGKKHLEIKPIHQKMLYDFYRPYNEELFSLLGRRFNWEPKS